MERISCDCHEECEHPGGWLPCDVHRDRPAVGVILDLGACKACLDDFERGACMLHRDYPEGRDTDGRPFCQPCCDAEIENERAA